MQCVNTQIMLSWTPFKPVEQERDSKQQLAYSYNGKKERERERERQIYGNGL